MMFELLASALAANMPLPPPGQFVRGVSSIPDMRNGPLFSWTAQTVQALDWQCSVKSDGPVPFQIAGRFEQMDIVPSSGPLPQWTAYAVTTVHPSTGHDLHGQFLATYSGKHYAYRFASAGQAFEVAVRFESYDDPGTVELRRFRPGTDANWLTIGTGTCSGKQLPLRPPQAK